VLNQHKQAMRAELPTGTVTFLFTDIEGSTRLLHALGPDGYAEALAEHRRALREAFAAHGGVEVDTQGDAFFVAFPTAVGAAAAAQASHAALSAGPVRVRIGLHTGAPLVTGEGYVGADVHRGARVAALAHGGQTLVSPATTALLDGSALVDLGLHRLKDFDGATRLHQLGGGTHPPLRSPGTVQLPTPATAFLGREHELHQAVTVLFEHDPRLLTILGPGGTGKTRFAIELARLLAEDADGGTYFVPLAPLHDPELVLATIAQALGSAEPTLDALTARLATGRTHLLLDNLEQLLPDAAAPIAALVAATPALRLLITSREALRVQGEQQLELPPLVEEEAVELFLTRAHSFRLDIQRTPAVEQLCERLDRLPLALELAAARTKLLSPEALLDRLGGRLDLLRGSRDSDPRQATLRATIAWSYDLLTPAEQTLFARLSVFAAGCTLENAEAVCDADLPELESLLDKSLLRRRTGPLGEDRYWMLETIRQYAFEQLDASGEAGALQRRHAERMLEIAVSAHLSPETGLGVEPQRHDLVNAERQDVYSALDWAQDNDFPLALELYLALENGWASLGPSEGARRLELLLERVGPLPPEQEARLLRVRGNFGNLEGAALSLRRYEESLAAYRALGDERGATIVLVRIAANAMWNVELEELEGPRALAREALDLAQKHGLTWVEAQALSTLAVGQRRGGSPDAARPLLRRAADLAEECGFHWWQTNALGELLELALELGRPEEGREPGREALRVATAMDDRWAALWVLAGLGRIELETGSADLAGRLWGAAVDAEERYPFLTQQHHDWLHAFAAPLVDSTDPRFLAAVEAGRELGLAAATRLALGEE
jgi:predicted ATPase/class 3 adenylate cyclase